MSFIRANALSPVGSPYGSMLLLGHIGKALFIGRGLRESLQAEHMACAEHDAA
jgi:hypothetical protein